MTHDGIQVHFKPGHDDEDLIVRTDAELDAVFEEFLAEPFEHSVACFYLHSPDGVDPELAVGVSVKRGVGALEFGDPDGTWYSRGAGHTDDLFFCYYGEDRDFPPDAELPLADVRAAVREFLHTGQRPLSVRWQTFGT